MGDSDDYSGEEEYQPQVRVRRHRFKTFAERVADVDVGVYRSLAPVRATPLHGAASFTAEALIKWRELNSSEPFLEIAAELNPLVETLPLLVHHADQIFKLLLDKTAMRHVLGLPAILALHVALARDLQEDHARRMFQPLMAALADLLDVQGADRDTEVMEQVFISISHICKQLGRHLAPILPRVLSWTQGIRYARSSHVRLFAAQAFGFLLRLVASSAYQQQAPASSTEPTHASIMSVDDDQHQEQQQQGHDSGAMDIDASSPAQGVAMTPLRRAVRAVLAEQAVQADEQRTDGAGLLLAESVLGVSHGLHSRAPLIVELLFSQDVITVSDFNPSKNAAGDAPETMFTQEQLRARAAAVASVALERILSHLRRGKCDVLWAALFKEAGARMAHLKAVVEWSASAQQQGDTLATTPSKRSKPSKGKAKQETAGVTDASDVDVQERKRTAYFSAARIVAHVAQAVHFFRGSRVESYEPLQGMIKDLVKPWAWPARNLSATTPTPSQTQAATTQALTGQQASADVKDPAAQQSKKRKRKDAPEALPDQPATPATTSPEAAGKEDNHEPFLTPSLSQQTLRLVLGVIHGHTKVVGASEGLSALTSCVTTWAPCFLEPPAKEVLPFLAGLLSYPAGPEVVRMFSARILGSVGHVIMSSDPDHAHASTADSSAQRALGFLVQVCDVLQPRAFGAAFQMSALPLLVTAQPNGVKLAAAIRKLLSSWAEATQKACSDVGGSSLQDLPASHPMATQQVSCAWAALQLLPHASESASQAVTLCNQSRAAAEAAVNALEASSAAGNNNTSAILDGLLCVHGISSQMLAGLISTEIENATDSAAPKVQDLTSKTEQSLAWLEKHPSSVSAAIGAAAMMQALRTHAGTSAAATQLLSLKRLQAVLPPLLPHLASTSQAVRAAVLQLLCSFDQPQLAPPSNVEATPTAATLKVGKVEVLPLLLAINSEACTLEAGRRWSVALIRQGGHAEYNRIPDYLIPALVYGLLGVLRVRFSPLWPATVQALAACLQHHPKVTWPIVLSALTSTQDEFLNRSTNTGSSHGKGKRGNFKQGKGGKQGGNKNQTQTEEDDGEDEDDTMVVTMNGEEEVEEVLDMEGLAEGEKQLQAVPSLESKFLAASTGQTDDTREGTDAVNRLTHLVRSLAKVPSQVMEPVSKDWVPLFLTYAEAQKVTTEPGADATSGVSVLSRVGTRVYRTQLAEWLTFLAGIKGARGMFKAQDVQVAVALQLDADEPSVQAAALKCLQAFKHKYLNEHMERLLRLADNKTLRSELASFPLAVDAQTGGVSPAHRPGLLPVLCRVLFPKLRRRTGRLAGKGALGSARNAVLNFLAFAEPLELRPLLELFLLPIEQVFTEPANNNLLPLSVNGNKAATTSTKPLGPGLALVQDLEAVDKARLFPTPWWFKYMGSAPTSWWLSAVDSTKLAALPARRKVGFLNAFDDLLNHLGHRLAPLLPTLLALTLRLLEEATEKLQEPGQQQQVMADGVIAEEDRSKEIRQSALKLLSQLWSRFPGGADYNDVWGVFFRAVQPLMARMAVESTADKEPPLLSCVVAIAASSNLLPVLGNLPSTTSIDDAAATAATPVPTWAKGGAPAWAAAGMGGKLLSSCIAVLHAKNCSQASRVAVLNIIDCILEECTLPTPEIEPGLPVPKRNPTFGPLFQHIMQPWVDDLLVALKSIITTAWQGKDISGVTAGVKNTQAAGQRYRAAKRQRYRALRELEILEKLGSTANSPLTARLLGDALASLVTGVAAGAGARRGAKAKLNESGLSRALAALATLWTRLSLGGDQKAIPKEEVQRYWEALSSLALRLQTREGRTALAATYVAASKLLPSSATDRAANLLTDMTAWSTIAIDEPDYDARMRAYSALQVPVWMALGRWQALPVLMACLHDVRNDSDLALRQAAAAALERFVGAAGQGAQAVHDSSREASSGDDEQDQIMQHDNAGVAVRSSSRTSVLVRYPSQPQLHILDTAHSVGNAGTAAMDADTPRAARRTAGSGTTPSKSGNAAAAPTHSQENSLVHLIPRVLYPQLRSQLSNTSLAVRQEHLQLLRVLVLEFSQQFPDLVALTNANDQETDFFYNVAHLQQHRQVRALNRLATLAKELVMPVEEQEDEGSEMKDAAAISVRCIMDVAVPLILVCIGDGNADAGRAHDETQTDVDKTANVVDAAQRALSAIAGALPWMQYDQLLGQCLRMLRGSTSKASIRAVCQILDAFHFELPQDLGDDIQDRYKAHVAAVAAAKRLQQQQQRQKQEQDAAKEDESSDDDDEEDEDEEEKESEGEDADGKKDQAKDKVDLAGSDQDQDGLSDGEGEDGKEVEKHEADQDAVDDVTVMDVDPVADQDEDQEDPDLARAKQAFIIQRALTGRVMPVLHRLLVSKGRNGSVPSARAPVALAIAKLVKLLPQEVERRELPRALGSLASLLLERNHGVRDDTRAVLISMAKELGPSYMPYIINVLRATLPDRGFTAHVLGFTMHCVLDGVVGHMLSRKARARAASMALAPTSAEEEQAGGAADTVNDDDDEDALTGLDQVNAAGDDSDADEDQQDHAQQYQGAAKQQLRGVLDDCLELALPIIENEIFGNVAQAKEIAKFANNYKEAKKVRGYESYMLLASSVTFATHMGPLMDLVRSKLHLAGAPSVRNRLSHLLQHAMRGIAVNPTATAEPMATWLHVTLDQGVGLDEAARQRAKEAVGAADGIQGKQPAKVAAVGTVIQGTVANSGRAKKAALTEQEAAALHHYLVTDAALQLLRSSLRKGGLSGKSPATLQLLDPLLPLLVRCLKSRHAPSVSLALRSLSHLVKLPLPHLPQLAPATGKAVTQLLKKAPNATHPLAQEGFRLLAALMRECSTYQPTTQQVRFLLTWLLSDRHSDQGALTAGPGFALLRSILSKKLVVPEIYDVMNWVQQLMVKSMAPHVRSTAASCLLQFLLDYPLGQKRLASHCAFLATNLSYEGEEGRIQVLGMIQQVTTKFPEEVISGQAELFLLPLVTRLVNDPSAKGRAAVAQALAGVLTALPASQQDNFADFCSQWLSGDNIQLRRAAIQSLGLLAEAEGGARFAKRILSTESNSLAAPLRSCLTRQMGNSSLAAGDALETDENLSQSCPGWQEAYYTIVLFEKVLVSAPTSLPWPAGNAGGTVPQVWDNVIALLLHKHAWVRKAAARLLGIALATPTISAGLCSRPGMVGHLAFLLYMQLNCEHADEGTCKQAVKCLIPITSRLYQQHLASPQDAQQLASQQQDATQRTANGHADEAEEAANEVMDEEQQEQAPQESDDNDGDGNNDNDAENNNDEDEDDGEGEGEDKDEGDGDDQHNANGVVDANGNAAAAEVDTDDSYEADRQEDENMHTSLTLPGLMRRMARLADTHRYSFLQQRLAALRWIAAVATKLGAQGIQPFLDILVVPLFRLSETSNAKQAVPEHVQEAAALSEEVMSHLRSLLGADVLLAAYNAARDKIRNIRAQRKTKQAMRAMLDPEALAAEKLRRGRKKVANKKRKMEDVRRERSASTYGGQARKAGKSSGRAHGGGRGRGPGGRGGDGGRDGGRGRGGSGVGKMYAKSRAGGTYSKKMKGRR